MFWSFMSLVHNLPSFERKDIDPWWNKEEEKALGFINEQLSYMDQSNVCTLAQELGVTRDNPEYWNYSCIGPVLQQNEGQLVWGLDEMWCNFLSKHLNIGKYLGAFSKDIEEFPFICYKCGESLDVEEDFDGEIEGFTWDMNGPGRTFDGTVEEVVSNKKSCPCCGTECNVICFEEGGDINTIWVFEKASIAYCHYGRGAGMSFKYHTSLDMKGNSPLNYFKGLINQD